MATKTPALSTQLKTAKVEIADVLKQFIDNPEDYSIIRNDRLDDLLDTELQMIMLESYGVDNWQGYDAAMQEYEEMKDEAIQKLDEAIQKLNELEIKYFGATREGYV